MTVKVRCEYISWARFYRMSRMLSAQIHGSGFKPDIIIAIGRGGYMPARIVSDFLHIMNLASFKIEHYQGAQKKPAAKIRYPLSSGMEGERVLLVDDVCDTGDTLAVARKHVMEHMQPMQIRTAAMHYKKVSTFRPDFYAARVVKWRWIIYPWAAAEDITGFMQQMQPQPGSLSAIREILARDYNVRIPTHILEDILAMSRTEHIDPV